MGNRWDDEWDSNSQIYTPAQVEGVLKGLGINVVDETETHFISLCPYHANSDTPAFATNKSLGMSICFNPACAVGSREEGRLDLERLVRELKSLNHFEAKRFILQHKAGDVSFAEQFDALQAEPEELPLFSQEAIDRMKERFWQTPAAVDYMKGRGFERETLEFFNVGFTPSSVEPVYKPDMIVVPAYDHMSRPVGLVGRSLEGKTFRNFGTLPGGKGFKKSHIVWNLNNARKHEKIILTEATFDSMRVHQAGYPNTGALLGGSLSTIQENLLSRHFTGFTVMTDNETGDRMVFHRDCKPCLRKGHKLCQGHQPGRDLGMQLVKSLPRMRAAWAVHDDKFVYANNVKDASDMSDDQIRQSLRNSISHIDYLDWMVA